MGRGRGLWLSGMYYQQRSEVKRVHFYCDRIFRIDVFGKATKLEQNVRASLFQAKLHTCIHNRISEEHFRNQLPVE